MFRLTRPSVLAAAFVAAALGGIACDLELAKDVKTATITASILDALPDGVTLDIAFDDNTLVMFNYNDGVFLDLHRVNLAFSTGVKVAAYEFAKKHSPWNLLRRQGEFAVAENPLNFTTLSVEEADLLKQFGSYSKESLDSEERYIRVRTSSGGWVYMCESNTKPPKGGSL